MFYVLHVLYVGVRKLDKICQIHEYLLLKCARFCFFFGFFFFSDESWAAAHGLYRCTVYRLVSEPMSTRLLNSISSKICCQNTQFNMYTTTSKQQEGCTRSKILIQNVL